MRSLSDDVIKLLVKLTVIPSTIPQTTCLIKGLICKKPIICLQDQRVVGCIICSAIAVILDSSSKFIHYSQTRIKIDIASSVEGCGNAHEGFRGIEETTGSLGMLK